MEWAQYFLSADACAIVPALIDDGPARLNTQVLPTDPVLDFLAGGGEMGARFRAHDWSTSPVGNPEHWPQSLRTAVSIMLNSRHPMFLAWGPKLAFLYNDGYVPIFGAKHPRALGKPFAEIWSEIWSDIRPLVDRALAGEATWSEDLHLVMERHGYPEDTWYTFSYSPIRDESGGVAGMFCACTETTAKVLAERRLRFQLQLGERLLGLPDPVAITISAAEQLGTELRASRVGYGQIDQEEQTIYVARDWTVEGMASLAGERRPLVSFGPTIIDALKAGDTLRLNDVYADPRSAPYAEGYESIGARAMIVVPLVRQGALRAVLYVHEPLARRWTDIDVGMAQDCALRTWSAVVRARSEQQRRRAEDALNRERAAESERLRHMFEQAPSFIAVTRGPTHVFELVNHAYLRLVGGRDVVGKPVREALPEVVGQGFFKMLDEVYSGGQPRFANEAQVVLQRTPDGPMEDRFVDFVYQPIRNTDGEISGIFVEGQDITERKRADEALRESETRLRLAVQAGRMSIVTFDLPTSGVSHSPSFAQLLGFPADHRLTLEDIRSRYHPDDYQRVLRERAAILAGRDTFYDVEHRVVWSDGSVHWLYGRGEVARSESGKPLEVTAIYIDITEQRRIQAALRESEQQFRTFSQVMPNHVWAARANGSLDWFNDRVYEYTGVPPGMLDGQQWLKVIHPEDAQASAAVWSAAVANGTTYETEFRIRRADGAYRWHLARALPIRNDRGEVVRWIGTNTDIEDQKASAAELARLNATLETRVEQRSRELRHAEEALRHAQKMEAVGQLTGGIAHDFNNMLTGIIGSLDIVKRRLASGRMSDVDRFMEAAVASANRAAALTHRLLAFSRRQSLDPKPIELNRLVQSMEDLLRRTLAENIQLELRLEQHLWLAEADANQLESALLNLVINARDAMSDGGELIIATANRTLTTQSAARFEGLTAGDYIELSVQDTGHGMPPHVLERAFDPFFTTKPIGQGTGLGLSMIYGFAKQSRGHARLESEVGRGTNVTLYLPRFSGAVANDSVLDGIEAPRARAGEAVLVVEDEGAVRMLITDVLEELGYEFMEAADANGALPLLQSSRRIDLMISDVGLPGMNGRQLAEAARLARPDLKVLFITGYAQSAATRAGFLEPGMEMITKPFALDHLATKVREMLQS